jgi:hypothetical protein
VAVAAATIAASGAGFVGYVGQVDAHPFGWSAVAVWLALMGKLALGQPLDFVSPRVARAIAAGLTLCVAAFTIEVGYPLLLFLWLSTGIEALWAARKAGERRDLLPTFGSLVLASLAFIVPFVAFEQLAERLVFLRVTAANDVPGMLRDALGAIRVVGPDAWGMSRLGSLASEWPYAFPWPVTLLFLVGMAVVPPRWAWRAVALTASFATALALTRVFPRDIYLIAGLVYSIAAAGAVRLSTAAARVARSAAGPELAPLVRFATLGFLLVVLIATQNADLWGDFTLARAWHHI